MAEDPPIGGPPAVLSPATYARHEGMARYVESVVRTRGPRPGSGRWPRLAPGAWGKLASGATIAAGSGMTLGTGTVTLSDRTGAAMRSPAETVTVYNPGGSLSGPKVLPLEWTGGVWSVCGCGSSCSQTFNVQGCSGFNTSGAPVAVYDHSGGSLLASGTTDASGNVTLSWSGGCNVYVTAAVPCPGFVAYGSAMSLVAGGTSVITLATATGYICCGAHPVKTTLFVTDSNGTLTLTRGAGFWGAVPCLTTSGTFTKMAHNGFGQCIVSSGSLNYTYAILCSRDPVTKIDRLTVQRGWRTYTTVGIPHTYCDICGPDSTCNTNSGASIALFDIPDCGPIAATVTPVFSSGFLPDPVGGSVTVTQ